MVQTSGAGSKFPELDTFLGQLYIRWSRDACSAFCALEPGANNSAARAIFDEELAVLREIPRVVEHAFRTLSAHVGSQRNKYCEINALPSEILREIFLSACENGLRWKDLASIIKTCKPWYNILAHDPAAYSTINLGDYDCSSRLAKSFAARSRLLPLNLTWTDTGMGTSVSKWKGRFCAEHLCRTKTLKYAQFDTVTDEWLHESPAPQLKRCELFRFAADEDEDEDEDTREPASDFHPEYHILPSLFGGNAPKLHVLTLHNVRLAWRPGNYSDLTHLTIVFHPTLLAQSKLDTDYLTVIFQDSPRLEHVELTTGGDEVVRVSRNGSTFVRQHDTQSRYAMRHLHTLRIHLPAFNLIHILRTIEITDRIKTVDLHCHDSSDEKHCQVLGANILPRIFATLHTISLGSRALEPVTGVRRGMTGSGSFGDHEYSFIYTPFNWYDLPIVEDKFGSLLALKRIILCPTWIRPRLTEFLAVAPFVDELHILEGFSSVEYLQQLSSNPRNQPHLARVSHWAFISEENTSLWFFRSDIDLLKAFFQLLPSSRTRRTLSIAGFVKFEYPDGLQAAREFVVDLARVNVAITGPTKFDVGWDDHDQYDKVNWVYIRTYMSVESLWPDGKVPDVVREVMKD